MSGRRVGKQQHMMVTLVSMLTNAHSALGTKHEGVKPLTEPKEASQLATLEYRMYHKNMLAGGNRICTHM